MRHAALGWQIGRRCAGVALGLAVTACPLLAQEAAPESPTPVDPKGTITILAPRKPGTANQRGVTYYIGESGRPLLTNRHERYRNNPEYRVVHEVFEPIVVPGRFKFYTSAEKYTDADIGYLVERYAAKYGLEESLVYAVIHAESNFNPHAVSRAGARGLMQLMPGTAAEMNVEDVFDPAQNIAGGAQYLSRLLRTFDNDLSLALAGYNAGPNAVLKHGGIPPFAETKAYVKRVEDLAGKYAKNEMSPHYRVSGKRPESGYLPREKSPFVVYFKNGYTQSADNVTEEVTHYFIESYGRIDSIRKDLVTKIEKG